MKENSMKEKFWFICFCIFMIVSFIHFIWIAFIYPNQLIDAANGGVVIEKYVGRYDTRKIVVRNNGNIYTLNVCPDYYYSIDVGETYTSE